MICRSSSYYGYTYYGYAYYGYTYYGYTYYGYTYLDVPQQLSGDVHVRIDEPLLLLVRGRVRVRVRVRARVGVYLLTLSKGILKFLGLVSIPRVSIPIVSRASLLQLGQLVDGGRERGGKLLGTLAHLVVVRVRVRVANSEPFVSS